MFTGIITHTLEVTEIEQHGRDVRMQFHVVNSDLSECHLGDSIAVSGICLTMTEINEAGFSADLSTETLSLTTAGNWVVGQRLHGEFAMSASGRFDGHVVTGHVDGTAVLISRIESQRSLNLSFRSPQELSRYIARKGSVCLDGVSLTVNEVDNNEFTVCIIPHTQSRTELGALTPGGEVNIEVDMFARYLERLMQTH